jgi:hypothetical protein
VGSFTMNQLQLVSWGPEVMEYGMKYPMAELACSHGLSLRLLVLRLPARRCAAHLVIGENRKNKRLRF